MLWINVFVRRYLDKETWLMVIIAKEISDNDSEPFLDGSLCSEQEGQHPLMLVLLTSRVTPAFWCCLLYFLDNPVVL